MRFISITKSINIRLDWANISGAVLKAGTPLDITGAVANSSAAVGILAGDAEKSSAEVAVVTEGSIDLGEIAASYGELDDAAISAMHGITFIDGGEPVAPSELPAVTSDDKDKFLHTNGSTGALEWAEASGGGGQFIITITENEERTELSVDKTYSEIASAYAAGKTFILATEGWVDADPFFARSVTLDESGYKISGGFPFIEAVSEDTAEVTIMEYSILATSDTIEAWLERVVVSGSYSSTPPVEF